MTWDGRSTVINSVEQEIPSRRGPQCGNPSGASPVLPSAIHSGFQSSILGWESMYRAKSYGDMAARTTSGSGGFCAHAAAENRIAAARRYLPGLGEMAGIIPRGTPASAR